MLFIVEYIVIYIFFLDNIFIKVSDFFFFNKFVIVTIGFSGESL